MSSISLLLLTHNSFDHLKKNLTWLDQCPGITEVIVVDDNSTDNTLKFLKSLKPQHAKIKIFHRDLNDDFSYQRNFGIDNTSNDYIFWLDPDEYPDKDLIAYINHIDIHQYKNYSFKRRDTFLHQELKYGENGNNSFIRLFNKHSGRFRGRVHEVWDSTEDVATTDYLIHHQPHRTLAEFFEKVNFYSTIRSRELFDSGKKSSLLSIIFWPMGKFIYDYIFLFGFLDGTPGIIMALGMSFHSFLVRAKLWHLYHP